MKQGDRVKLLSNLNGIHMFPLKDTDPDERTFQHGDMGTVEEVYTNGGGIVRFDNGKGLLASDLSSKFELVQEE